MSSNKKALIAMSGGVDSSVAASLMIDEGYECIGITMKLYAGEEVEIKCEKTCCSIDDVNDARNVASSLNMPYYVMNFKDKFEEKVIKKFAETYINGGTPNPCIDCNRYLKFDKLMDKMKELGYDYVVTGHYARVEYDEAKERYILKKGLDETKDQSYVLYNMTQDQLKHTKFPLGAFKKTEIREIAENKGFINARKHDSQDICFVPDGDYATFIENYCGKKFEEGEFVDKNGNVLGCHKGIIRYTIGQRKGLGITSKEPLYVCGKDVEKNQVILGSNNDVFGKELYAEDVNWVSIEEPKEPFRCKAKIRYKQREEWGTVYPESDGKIKIVFDNQTRGITKGQAVVLYEEDAVLGGGIITTDVISDTISENREEVDE